MVEHMQGNFPENDDAIEKLHGRVQHGCHISWYFSDDVEYAHDCAETEADVRADPPFAGLVVATHGTEICGRELEVDDAIVVIHKYPTEKCNPEATWLPLGDLMDLPNLVRIWVTK